MTTFVTTPLTARRTRPVSGKLSFNLIATVACLAFAFVVMHTVSGFLTSTSAATAACVQQAYSYSGGANANGCSGGTSANAAAVSRVTFSRVTNSQ